MDKNNNNTLFSVGQLKIQLYAVDMDVDSGCGAAMRRRPATTQTVATARASERRDGPCRVPAPYLTRSERGKDRGGGTRRSTRRSSGSTPPPRAQHTAHYARRRRQCAGAVGAPGLTASTRSGRRSGSAAHRGADRRLSSRRPASPRS